MEAKRRRSLGEILSELEKKRTGKGGGFLVRLRKFAPSPWVSVIISLLALLLTVTLNTSALGSAKLSDPSGYGISRGLRGQTCGESPSSTSGDKSLWTIECSDHIFIPLDWRNSSGSEVLIKEPQLTLQKKDAKNDEESLHFFLLGEYPNIATARNGETQPDLTSTLALKPHSATQHIAVFRIEQSWIDKNNTPFRLDPKKGKYQAYVSYGQVPHHLIGTIEEVSEPLLVRGENNWLNIQPKVRTMKPGDVDYWSIQCGARAEPPGCETNVSTNPPKLSALLIAGFIVLGCLGISLLIYRLTTRQ